MRPRRRLETAESEAIKAAVRKAFSEEQQARDDAFAQQAKRLLQNLDEFTKESGDGRPA